MDFIQLCRVMYKTHLYACLKIKSLSNILNINHTYTKLNLLLVIEFKLISLKPCCWDVAAYHIAFTTWFVQHYSSERCVQIHIIYNLPLVCISLTNLFMVFNTTTTLRKLPFTKLYVLLLLLSTDSCLQ